MNESICLSLPVDALETILCALTEAVEKRDLRIRGLERTTESQAASTPDNEENISIPNTVYNAFADAIRRGL